MHHPTTKHHIEMTHICSAIFYIIFYRGVKVSNVVLRSISVQCQKYKNIKKYKNFQKAEGRLEGSPDALQGFVCWSGLVYNHARARTGFTNTKRCLFRSRFAYTAASRYVFLSVTRAHVLKSTTFTIFIYISIHTPYRHLHNQKNVIVNTHKQRYSSKNAQFNIFAYKIITPMC